MPTNFSQILKLSITPRILLVEAIWDSIAQETDKKNDYQLNEDQINFLEEEIAAYDKDSGEGSTWEEIKNRIKNKK
jgi:putative addiction module component (TIGR02574 family)